MAANDPEQSQLWAAYDAKAAVRWLRTNAKKYRIDTARIGAFGSSAGAMTVAFMSTVEGMGDNLDHPEAQSGIRAGVSLSGALECIGPNAKWCEVVPNVTWSHPPFLDFHGCDDHTVPCESGCSCSWHSNQSCIVFVHGIHGIRPWK
jgi:acetyl esterase